MKSFSESISDLNAVLAGTGLKSELVRGGIGSLTLKAAYILLTFFTSVTLARLLGADGYGVYTYILALVYLFTIPVEFGFPNLVVRETAKFMVKQEWGMIQGVWRWTGKITVFLTVLLILGAGVVIAVFWGRFSPEQLIIIICGIALVPLVTLGNLRGAALRGLNYVIQGQLSEQLLLPGLHLLLIIGAVFIFSAKNLTPLMALSLMVIAAALSFFAGVWLLWRIVPLEIRYAKPTYASRLWLSSTLPLALTSGMGLIIGRAGIVLLGIFGESMDVGIYRVADQMAFLLSMGLQAINMVIAPQITRLYALGDKARLQQLATASARMALFLTLPVVVVFLLFGKPLLNLVFGMDFLPAYGPLAILSIGQLINSAAGSVGFLLNMTGHEQDTARVFAFATVGSILLNLILIPLWGTIGAAFASAITMVAWNVLLWLAVQKRLGINSMVFSMIHRRK